MMKHLLTYLLFFFVAVQSFAQKENFDLASYTPLKGWKKVTKPQAVQFTKEDAAKGIYCMITLYKSTDAGEDAKNNFDLSWEALVKEQFDANATPEMLQPAADDGWQVQTGYASFDKEGIKGIALLVSSTGYSKLINALIITNSDTYEKETT